MPQPYFFIIKRTLVESYTFYQIIFFVQLEKMAMNPYGHYSYADTIYTRNVTPV